MAISEVELKSGEIHYRVTVNAGVINGKRKKIVRQAKSKQEAQFIEQEIMAELSQNESGVLRAKLNKKWALLKEASPDGSSLDKMQVNFVGDELIYSATYKSSN